MLTFKYGITRFVFLTKRYAIKVPRPQTWKNFLNGILANIQEAEISTMGKDRLCPVLFSCLGFVVVMPRCEALSPNYCQDYICKVFYGSDDPSLRRLETKLENYGLLDGKLVCIDYA